MWSLRWGVTAPQSPLRVKEQPLTENNEDQTRASYGVGTKNEKYLCKMKSKKICAFYSKGKCKFGDACRFVHESPTRAKEGPFTKRKIGAPDEGATAGRAGGPGGKSYHVRRFIDRTGQKYLQTIFPTVNFIFDQRESRGHPVSATIRDMIYSRIMTRYGRFGKCVDVGTTPHLRKHSIEKHVHACEPCTEAYTWSRMAGLLEKKKWSDCFLGPTDDPLPDRYSHCACRVQECNHLTVDGVKLYDWMFFGHSIYYLTKRQLFEAMMKTRKKCAVAVLHKFENFDGTFNNGEVRYRVRYGKVECLADGDDHGYEHPACNWLFNSNFTATDDEGKQFFGEEEGEGEEDHPYTIVHSDRKQVGDNWIVVLRLTQRRFDHSRQEPLSFTLCTAPPGSTLDSLIPEDVKVLREAGAKRLWVGGKLTYVDIGSTAFEYIVLPRKALGKLISYACGRVQTSKYRKDVISQAKTLFSVHRYEELLDTTIVQPEWLHASALFAAYYARDVAARITVGTVEGWATLERKELIKRADHLLSVEDEFVRPNPLNPRYIIEFLIRYYRGNMTDRKNALSNLLDDWVDHNSTMQLIKAVFLLIVIVCIVCFWSRLIPGVGAQAVLVQEVTVQCPKWEPRGMTPQAVLLSFGILGAICVIYQGIRNRRRDPVDVDRIAMEDWLSFANSERRTYHTRFKFTHCTGPEAIESRIDPDDFPPSATARYDESKMLPPREVPPVGTGPPGVVAAGIVFSGSVPTVFSRSTHNLVIGIKTRAIPAMEGPVGGSWKLVNEIMEDFCIPLEPFGDSVRCCRPDHYQCTWYRGKNYRTVGIEEYLARYPPRKRELILEAADRYHKGSFKYGHLAYTAFVKLEKIVKMTTEEWVPQRPRLIQGLSQLAKYLAGTWFYNYGLALKVLCNPGTRVYYCSGSTAGEVSEWFNQTMRQYANPLYISCDFSKYDVTQCAEAMRRECDFYRSLGFCESVSEGKAILASKLRARVYAHGIKYSVEGTRKSGDLDTSSGNSKMTTDLIYSFFRYHNLGRQVHMIVLGDDNLVIASHIAVVREFLSVTAMHESLVQWVQNLGCVLKCSVVSEPAQAEFLSRRFYPLNSGQCVVGVKPGRLLSKIGWFIARQGRSDTEYLQCVLGTCQSLLDTCHHVPFARVYVNKVISYCTSLEIESRYHEDVEFWLKGQELFEADETTWAAFTAIYGLTREDEEIFAADIDEALGEGLPYMLDSRCIDHMVSVDFSM